MKQYLRVLALCCFVILPNSSWASKSGLRTRNTNDQKSLEEETARRLQSDDEDYVLTIGGRVPIADTISNTIGGARPNPPTPEPTNQPTPAPPDPPEPITPIVEELVVAWYQCSSEQTCDKENGYGSSKDCGYPGIPFFECPLGESCEVLCTSMDTYCYNATSDTCILHNSATCQCDQMGMECKTEHSFACGPRVCKNTTIAADYEACTSTECKDSSDCAGAEMECVAYHLDCGFAV